MIAADLIDAARRKIEMAARMMPPSRPREHSQAGDAIAALEQQVAELRNLHEHGLGVLDDKETP